jgi:pimeloyl-ACP methyl ester carboxylesterase
VALRVGLEDERVAALSLIAMSARAPDESDIVVPALPSPEERRRFTRPVLVLVGDRDQYCPLPQQEDLARSFGAATLQVISDADHYFAGREPEAAINVAAFARGALLQEDRDRSER